MISYARRHAVILGAFIAALATQNVAWSDMKDVDKIWSSGKPAVVEQWRRSQEVGLPHNEDNLSAVIVAFENYVIGIKSLPTRRNDAQVLRHIEELYGTLDKINEAANHGLLETGEREVLVPIIVDIAIAAGLDPNKYNGEPGGEYRDF
jgi:hypothetical protein